MPKRKVSEMTSIVTPPDIKGIAPKTAILAGIKPDMDMLVKSFESIEERIPLFMAQILIPKNHPEICVAGPFMGAPYAVMIMETLIAWGVKNFIFQGWCGSISESLKIGSILIPESAFIDEGVSKHYSDDSSNAGISCPDFNFSEIILKKTEEIGHIIREGKIWTTDAPYMETPEKIAIFRDKGAVAVDMETSALFSVAKKRGVAASAILVVSDELFTLKWKTGFKEERFKKARKSVCDLILNICLPLGKYFL